MNNELQKELEQLNPCCILCLILIKNRAVFCIQFLSVSLLIFKCMHTTFYDIVFELSLSPYLWGTHLLSTTKGSFMSINVLAYLTEWLNPPIYICKTVNSGKNGSEILWGCAKSCNNTFARSNVQKESHKSAIECTTDLSYSYFMERNMFFAYFCR